MSLLVGKDAIKLKEVSSRLSISTRTLYKHINNGKLRAFKIGNDWYVSSHDYDAYVASLQGATKIDGLTPKELDRLVNIMTQSDGALSEKDKKIKEILTGKRD